MLLLGICNPAGEGATYNGLYYKQDELASMVADGCLHDVPVKQEHSGGDVGRVVSSFVRSDGALQCVMEVDDSTVEGSIAVHVLTLSRAPRSYTRLYMLAQPLLLLRRSALTYH